MKISYPSVVKYVLILKRTVLLRRFFEYQEHVSWLRNKKMNLNFALLSWDLSNMLRTLIFLSSVHTYSVGRKLAYQVYTLSNTLLSFIHVFILTITALICSAHTTISNDSKSNMVIDSV